MDDVNFKPGVAQVAQVITSVAQVVLPDLEATETCIFLGG
jgi:phage tail protein X